ncbi:ATP-dependent helicase [Natronincola ferrireducens]|uniref:DNA 3'-5' helicase n=1 Tax=Natronincola ferrireducens TaxID=393762 RepID=A0A1G9BJ68_9FIRM|nr:ATP-dependent helicase [Natronincola ferrireducens]SDK39558.1 DNA helicase-2 / ATP-dependent DNA helicase PcrA [Natronincola ferrireducens]
MFEIQLNEQQKNASLHKDGPAIVLAVAGAGKTTTLCTRIANLIINYNVNPKKIKTMTFSRAAARDMKERFIKLFGGQIPNIHDVEFSTIHSFAYSVIRYYYRQKDLPLIIIEDEKEETNKYRILKDIFKETNKEYITEEQLEELLANITYIKNMMLKPKEIEELKNSIKNFSLIFEAYEKIKRENHYIDYDDMLTVAYHILLKEPQLLRGLQNKYDYWQVDEFQDTSRIQYEILKLLVKPNNNLFCVGDDDQTLYSWRGSYPKILLEFPKEFRGAQVYFMEENFRSTQDIINLSNRVISLNKQRYKKNIFTKKDKGLPVFIEEFNNEKTQIETIIQEIKAKSPSNEVAILFRNNFSALPFIDSFHEMNIPFYVREHKMSFFKHWIVKDIIAFIKFTYRPCSLELFNNIYYKLNAYLSKQSIGYVAQQLKEMDAKERENINIFDLLLTYPALKEYQKNRIIRLKYEFDVFKKENTSNFMEFIRRRLSYDEYLKNQDLTSEEVVNNTMGVLEHLARNVTTGLQFIDKVEALRLFTEKASHNKIKTIVLSTIHAAKGLEFDDVYIIDVIEDVLPSASSLNLLQKNQDVSELEEERRIFYVALTRARSQLKICTVKKRFNNSVEESMFIKEVKKFLNITSPKTRPIPKSQKHKVNPRELDISIYKKGTYLTHKFFGKGYISMVNQGIATVDFKSFGVKKIDIKTCMEYKLLS